MELEHNRQRLAAEGWGICAISYDPVEVLRDFAQRRGITFPLLADPDSSIIRRFGLLNEEVDPAGRDYGVPYPATFLVDERGIVVQKIKEEHYIHRLPVTTLLVRLGKTPPLPPPRPARQFAYLEILTAATETSLRPGNLVTLYADLQPHPGVHVYAPGVAGYQGVELTVEPQPYLKVREVHYPTAEALHIPVLGETLAVYDRPVRIGVDVALGNRLELQPVYDAGGTLEVRGTLAFQACDDRACYPPQRVPLVWTFSLLRADLERPPESLQHRARGERR